MDDWKIWALVAILVLLVLGAIWFFLKSKGESRSRARIEAEQIRERALGGEQDTQGREAIARQTQQEADAAATRAERAQQEAERMEQQARDATLEAREHRDEVTEQYLEADEIDPDVKM